MESLFSQDLIMKEVNPKRLENTSPDKEEAEVWSGRDKTGWETQAWSSKNLAARESEAGA